MPHRPSTRSPRPAPPGRISTTALSLAAIALVLAAVVAALVAGLHPAPDSASPTPTVGQTGGEIRGTISVVPSLAGRAADAAALFVIARKAAGHPFAVVRLPHPRLPIAYRLGPEHVLDGSPLAGEFTLTARLSRTGEAGPAQPGDVEGARPGLTPAGVAGADIVLTDPR